LCFCATYDLLSLTWNLTPCPIARIIRTSLTGWRAAFCYEQSLCFARQTSGVRSGSSAVQNISCSRSLSKMKILK
jgi:hypothetical protein